MKRWIALLLVLLMVLPLAACDKEEKDKTVWSYDERSRELTISGGEMGNYSEIERPWEGLDIVTLKIEGVPAIGDWAFAGCKTLQSVIISDGVTAIGPGAFADCDRLMIVEVPDSVQMIGSQCFRACFMLRQFHIPYGVPAVPDGMFAGCASLESVTIPGTAVDIGAAAFYECASLRSVRYIGSKDQWIETRSPVMPGNEVLDAKINGISVVSVQYID